MLEYNTILLLFLVKNRTNTLLFCYTQQWLVSDRLALMIGLLEVILIQTSNVVSPSLASSTQESSFLRVLLQLITSIMQMTAFTTNRNSVTILICMYVFVTFALMDEPFTANQSRFAISWHAVISLHEQILRTLRSTCFRPKASTTMLTSTNIPTIFDLYLSSCPCCLQKLCRLLPHGIGPTCGYYNVIRL